MRERLTLLQQEGQRLRVRLKELVDLRWTDQDAQREYNDVNDRKVEVDRDSHALAWFLEEEQ
jgi:hypothetical protein